MRGIIHEGFSKESERRGRILLKIRVLETFDYSLLERLREHDKREAKVLYNIDTHEDLKTLTADTLMSAEESYGIYIEDRLEGVYGVSRHNTVYSPWLFGSSKLETINSVTFARYSKRVTQEWFDKYPTLDNHALASYELWRWLGWLGFKVDILRERSGFPYILHFYYHNNNHHHK